MRRAIVLLAGMALTGCSKSAPLSAADEQAALQWLRQDRKPLAVEPVASWYANGEPGEIVCGEIKAPPALHQATLRYTYDVAHHYGQVELHKLWMTSDRVGDALVADNRSVFDDTWKNYCAPYAPIGRRIGHIFSE